MYVHPLQSQPFRQLRQREKPAATAESEVLEAPTTSVVLAVCQRYCRQQRQRRQRRRRHATHPLNPNTWHAKACYRLSLFTLNM